MTDEGIHHIVSDIAPVLIIISLVIASVSVLKLIVGAVRGRAQLRAQTDFHHKMLEKFSSAEEFTAYLESDAGKNFFEKLTVEPAAPLTRILGSIQKGAIATLIGIGLLIASPQFTGPDSGPLLFLIGILSTATGAGFIISAVVSYRLAKSWGLIVTGQSTEKPTAAAVAAP